MNKYRTIASIGNSIERVSNEQFKASNISEESVGASIDPILGIDHFEIRGPIFPPHPHAGFSPITYLFDDGEGNFISRVSNGETHEAKPGGVIWNVSGSGLLHEEFPKVMGELSKGLQVLINLSGKDKMRKPEVFFVDGPNIPVFRNGDVEVRVVSGRVSETVSQINPPGGITFLDIKMGRKQYFETALPENDNVLLYVIEGEVNYGIDKESLVRNNAVSLNHDGEFISLATDDQHVHLVLISGKPLNEPIVRYGSVVGKTGGQSSFVMNTDEQIKDALARFNAGEMGVLEPANDY